MVGKKTIRGFLGEREGGWGWEKGCRTKKGAEGGWGGEARPPPPPPRPRPGRGGIPRGVSVLRRAGSYLNWGPAISDEERPSLEEPRREEVPTRAHRSPDEMPPSWRHIAGGTGTPSPTLPSYYLLSDILCILHLATPGRGSLYFILSDSSVRMTSSYQPLRLPSHFITLILLNNSILNFVT
jgi:hypothetical protein